MTRCTDTGRDRREGRWNEFLVWSSILRFKNVILFSVILKRQQEVKVLTGPMKARKQLK